jgi:hypothetical protein
MSLETWTRDQTKGFQKAGGARKPNAFRKLEEEENQMVLEGWRSK